MPSPEVASFDPSWVSAFAGLIAASTGAFLARRATKELDRWRTQQRETKKAAVAGEVLVASLRFLTAVASTTNLVVRGQLAAHDPNDEHKGMREASEADWNAIADISNEFIKVWELAETYLPEDVAELLEEIWEVRSDLQASQMGFFIMPLGEGTDFFKSGWGRVPREKLDALRVRARNLLRPLAQMADERSKGRQKAQKQLAAEEERKRLAAEKAAKQLADGEASGTKGQTK
jgi:hypothetical protein